MQWAKGKRDFNRKKEKTIKTNQFKIIVTKSRMLERKKNYRISLRDDWTLKEKINQWI